MSAGGAGDRHESSLDARHEWLLLGAQEKARSVVMLSGEMDVRSVLEVGSGTGAILERLDSLGFGERYYAIEPSTELLNYMTRRGAIGRLAAAEAATLRESRLGRGHYDLVVLSHVLEHVEDPGRLLCDALEIGTFVLVEIPLEGGLLGNTRALVRRWLTGRERRDNTAGHVQFFGYGDAGTLVKWCGGEVVSSRIYVPRAQIWRQFDQGPLVQKAYHAAVLSLSRLALGPWARYYYGHLALLIRARSSMLPSGRSRWPSANYYEAAGPSGNPDR